MCEGAGWNCGDDDRPCIYECTGSDPTNATLCAGDDTGLSTDTAKTVAASCTATKCQFTCNTGYVKSGTTCVAEEVCGDGVYNGPGSCRQRIHDHAVSHPDAVNVII